MEEIIKRKEVIQFEIPTAIFLEFYDPSRSPKFIEREHAFVPNEQECVGQLTGFPNVKMILAWPNKHAVNLTITVAVVKDGPSVVLIRMYMNHDKEYPRVWVEFSAPVNLRSPVGRKMFEICSRAAAFSQELDAYNV